ncbi:MAG: hypothetical protein ACYCQI_07045 [Gammaproteobacteria bacterium]
MWQRHQPSYPSTYELRKLNEPLKKDVEEAESACGKDLVEPQLLRMSKIFDNYMILRSAIRQINAVLAVATKQFNESAPGSERQKYNHNVVQDEQKKLADYEATLLSMEDKLCEYVDNYKKAANSGDHKQALLNKAPITLWNVLCQSYGLCSPPENKVHGAEAIHARHARKDVKKESESDVKEKEKQKDHEKEKQRELAKRLSEDAERQEKEAAEARNREPAQPPGGPALQFSPPGGPALR